MSTYFEVLAVLAVNAAKCGPSETTSGPPRRAYTTIAR